MPPQIHLFPTRRSRPSFPYPSDPIRAHRLTAPAIPRAAQNHSGLIPVGRAGSWVQLASRGGRRCSGSTSKRCRGGSGSRRSGSSGRRPATAYCGSSLRPRVRRQGAIYESAATAGFFFWLGGGRRGESATVDHGRSSGCWAAAALLALLLASSGV